jgi:hypothetical protein
VCGRALDPEGDTTLALMLLYAFLYLLFTSFLG